MRRRVLAATAAAGAVALAGVGATTGARADSEKNFVAHLTGGAERPTPRETDAHGLSTAQLSGDGQTLVCKLNATRIDNVVQAHIHLGTAEQSGPVVAFLYGPVPAAGGRTNGRLSEVDVTAADLRGPLAGRTVDDLMREIRAGNAYVNVHTNDGVAPADTGPGDFPGGEIRGQLE